MTSWSCDELTGSRPVDYCITVTLITTKAVIPLFCSRLKVADINGFEKGKSIITGMQDLNDVVASWECHRRTLAKTGDKLRAQCLNVEQCLSSRGSLNVRKCCHCHC